MFFFSWHSSQISRKLYWFFLSFWFACFLSTSYLLFLTLLLVICKSCLLKVIPRFGQILLASQITEQRRCSSLFSNVGFLVVIVGASWCVCKTGLSDTVLQGTLDYACGNGADCNPTKPKQSCFNPDNVRSHCNYAVNSYFQKKGQSPGSCNFDGTATPTNSDPS